MSLFNLKNKSFLITGSSKGIGKSIAFHAASHGAKVIISSRKIDACKEVANEINKHPNLDKRLQYDFLLNSLRKRKRFTPWLKKEQIEDLDLVKTHYGYSNEKARVALTLLTKPQIEYIRKKHEKGGRQ